MWGPMFLQFGYRKVTWKWRLVPSKTWHPGETILFPIYSTVLFFIAGAGFVQSTGWFVKHTPSPRTNIATNQQLHHRKSNMTPENKPSQKERTLFQPSELSRAFRWYFGGCNGLMGDFQGLLGTCSFCVLHAWEWKTWDNSTVESFFIKSVEIVQSLPS